MSFGCGPSFRVSKVADDWKLKSREQIGQPKVLVDKPLSEW
jgi:hypothetical protein